MVLMKPAANAAAEFKRRFCDGEKVHPYGLVL